MDVAEGDADRSEGEKRDVRRPMNAFLIFCKRHRSMVREKHPERDNRSITRILGDLWANLALEEKLIYTNLAKQYKDAFMKANPDYKWHSSEKPPQPGKMSTRPTNTRVSGSQSVGDSPAKDVIVSGQLADPDKMGGLSLLLMAGQHTMGVRERNSPASVLERRMTSPDLGSSNSALLQLAEMCSTELHGKRNDCSVLRCAPPKKRARHWSYSEFGQAYIQERKSSVFLSEETSSAAKCSGLATENIALSPLEISTRGVTEVPVNCHKPCLVPDFDQPLSFRVQQQTDGKQRLVTALAVLEVDEDKNPKANSAESRVSPCGLEKDQERDYPCQPAQGTSALSVCLFPGQYQHVARPSSADVQMPPKKKFTKLQGSQEKEKLNWQETPVKYDFDWQKVQENIQLTDAQLMGKFEPPQGRPREALVWLEREPQGRSDESEVQPKGELYRSEMQPERKIDKAETHLRGELSWPEIQSKQELTNSKEHFQPSELAQIGRIEWPATGQEGDSAAIDRSKSSLKNEKLRKTECEEKRRLSPCLSDQNDNAILTCGKRVVDHIIDRLFSANMSDNIRNQSDSVHNQSVSMSGSVHNQFANRSDSVHNKSVSMSDRVHSQSANMSDLVHNQSANMSDRVHNQPTPAVSQSMENVCRLKADESFEDGARGHCVRHLLNKGAHDSEKFVEKVMTGVTRSPEKLVEKIMTGVTRGPEKLVEKIMTGVTHGPEKLVEKVMTGVTRGPEKLVEKVITGVCSLHHGHLAASSISGHAAGSAVDAACCKPVGVASSHPQEAAVCQTSQETVCWTSQETVCRTNQEMVCWTSQELMPSVVENQQRCEKGLEQSVTLKEGNVLSCLKHQVPTDITQDDDGDPSAQPVRKSRRRNRGRRYQELIKEGIIQPSKERLAARRMEMTCPAVSHSTKLDEVKDESSHESGNMPRPAVDVECTVSDCQRYCTGDFDLEAEIATLPACSLEQVSRRRLTRRCSEGEASKRLTCPHSPVKNELTFVPSISVLPRAQPVKCEPLIGSQKRKARKRSISRLLPLSCDSSGTTFSHSHSTQIPLVRDATAEPRDPNQPLVMTAVVTEAVGRTQPVVARDEEAGNTSSAKHVYQPSGGTAGTEDQHSYEKNTSYIVSECQDKDIEWVESSGRCVGVDVKVKQERQSDDVQDPIERTDEAAVFLPARRPSSPEGIREVKSNKPNGDEVLLCQENTQHVAEGSGCRGAVTQHVGGQKACTQTASSLNSSANVLGLAVKEDVSCMYHASSSQMCSVGRDSMEKDSCSHMCSGSCGSVERACVKFLCDHLTSSRSCQKDKTSDTVGVLCGIDKDVCSHNAETTADTPGVGVCTSGVSTDTSGISTGTCGVSTDTCGVASGHEKHADTKMACQASAGPGACSSGERDLLHVQAERDRFVLITDKSLVKSPSDMPGPSQSKFGQFMSNLLCSASSTPTKRNSDGGEVVLSRSKEGIGVDNGFDACKQSAATVHGQRAAARQGEAASAGEDAAYLAGRRLQGETAIDEGTQQEEVSRGVAVCGSERASDSDGVHVECQHNLLFSQSGHIPCGMGKLTTVNITSPASSGMERVPEDSLEIKVSTTVTSVMPSHFNAGSPSSLPCSVAMEISHLAPSSTVAVSPLTTAVMSCPPLELGMARQEVVTDNSVPTTALRPSPLPGSPSVGLVHS